MAAFIKYDGIAARNTQVLSSPRSSGRNRIIDVGDLPDGVSRKDQSVGGDRLDLSSQATEAQPAPAVDKISFNPLPTPYPNPRDSTNVGIDERA
jgi:hypothetical protein